MSTIPKVVPVRDVNQLALAAARTVDGSKPRWIFKNLCDYVDSFGVARITFKELCGAVCLGPKAIRRHMKTLVDQGHIEIVKQGKGESPTCYLIKALAAPLGQMVVAFPRTKHEAAALAGLYIISKNGRESPSPPVRQKALPFPPSKFPPRGIQ